MVDKMLNLEKMEVFVPIVIDNDVIYNEEEVIAGIIDQTVNYGIKRMLLCTPLPRWRGKHFPKPIDWENAAKKFLRIKNAVAPYGTECGWWVGITIKSGRDQDFSPMIKADGTKTPFSSCLFKR